jgi:hypothetical protein
MKCVQEDHCDKDSPRDQKVITLIFLESSFTIPKKCMIMENYPLILVCALYGFYATEKEVEN